VDPRIERLQRRFVAKPGVLSFAGGLPDAATFPLAALARALKSAGARALQYDWPEGREGLRSFIASRLEQRGAHVSPSDVIVTSGAQQAIDIATRLRAADHAGVWVPTECYPAALELFRSRSLRLSTEPSGTDLAYAMPLVGNPKGLPLLEDERTALLENSPFVIEDDAYADLTFDGKCGVPLIARAPERVAHVGTFSKTLCPGLRVGWLVVPPSYREAARRAKQIMDLQANGLAQCLVEHFVVLDDFERHLERLRGHYARRANALSEAMKRTMPSFRFAEPRGGFSLWVTSEIAGDDTELLATAMTHGVSFDPGRDFRPEGGSSPLAMRLSFSSLPIASMKEAARRLARAFAEYSRRHGVCKSDPHGHPSNQATEAKKGRRQAAPTSIVDRAGEKTDPVQERSGRATASAARA
jgi:2-aminoadipate transaminase